MSGFTKAELQKFKRKRLLSIIKSHRLDQNIDKEYQKKDGTLAKNLKSDTYIQLILDGQLQNNDENRNNNRAPAQFNQWKDDDYIELNKQRYGVGRCWDEQRHGYCGNPHCSYDHRSHHVTSNHNNRRPQSNIKMNWGKYKGTL